MIYFFHIRSAGSENECTAGDGSNPGEERGEEIKIVIKKPGLSF